MRVITAKNKYGDYYCEITKFIDSWLLLEYEYLLTKENVCGVYFNYKPKENIRVLKFWGEIRGYVQFVNDNIIEKIVIYKFGKGFNCYCEELETLLNLKYVGVKVIFGDGTI